MFKKLIKLLLFFCFFVTGCNKTDDANKSNDIKCDVIESKTSYESAEKTIKEYLKIMKSGKSDISYMERLKKIKSFVSVNAYEQLLPEKTDETNTEGIQHFDPRYIATNELNDIEVAIKPINSITADVLATYTLTISQQGNKTFATYFLKLKVINDNGKWIIDSIINDTILQ